ncbi:MAG: hypothetical protein ABSD98_19170 [Candidatus Korobacteraceae bacterium]|jgi:hypothetical protein
MNRFRWWRRLRGGRWAKMPGLLWGWRWVRLSPWDFVWDDCDENWGDADEYWKPR